MKITLKEKMALEDKVNAYNAVCRNESVKKWQGLCGEFNSLQSQRGFVQKKRYYQGGPNWIAYICPPYVDLKCDSFGASVTFMGWDGFINVFDHYGTVIETYPLRKGEANVTQERIRYLLEKKIKELKEEGKLDEAIEENYKDRFHDLQTKEKMQIAYREHVTAFAGEGCPDGYADYLADKVEKEMKEKGDLK